MKNKTFSVVISIILLITLTGCSFLVTTPSSAPVSTPTPDKSVSPQKTVVPTPDKPADNTNMLDSMSQSERREINLFLSNLSEANYGLGYHPNETVEKLDFAYIHNLLNNPDFDCMVNNEHMGISAELLDQTLTRFFGTSIPHQNPDDHWWSYSDGYFIHPPASGEFYGYFTIAEKATKNQDGTLSVSFNVYSDQDFAYTNVDPKCYSLSDADAAKKYEYNYSGTAVLKPVVYNGENTYQIIRYNTQN